MLTSIWKSKISLQTKMKIYNAVVISTLMYGAETWATTRKQEQRLDGFDSRCLRIILKVRWWHRKRNSDIRELTKQPYVSTTLKRNRLRWYRHMLQMDKTRLPNRLYHWNPADVGGRRRQGGQRQRWRDTCSRDLASIGLTLRETETTVANRGEWRTTIAALI